MIRLRDAIKLTREFYDKTKPFNDFDCYEEHVTMVGSCASIIASACGLDVMKAGVMGYIHDIGKLISNEKKEGTFHGLVGYEYFKKIGENELAQICLTHSFSSNAFDLEEYICYGKKNIEKTKSLLDKIEQTDYDRIIQLSDLLLNFNGFAHQYKNIKTRMSYIEKYYNVEHKYIRKKYKNAIHLKRYIEQKYNFNIYKLLGIK